MKFSQRQGIVAANKQIQIDSIDQDLANGLWNLYKVYIFDSLKNENDFRYQRNPYKQFTLGVWHNHFKLPVDEIPNFSDEVNNYIKNWFFSACWYEIYDFIEYCVNLVSAQYFEINIKKIETAFNEVLQREFAGYRFIQGKLAPITNDFEIQEINQAITKIKSYTALSVCDIHLQSAIEKLSDKTNPDYRNSIKESISAIEAAAKSISNNPNDSLGASLDKIKGKIKIHPSLEKGFKNIYGYTSASDGIRHALTDEPKCDFEDAKFMLVSCSAFLNYLIVKAEKAGVKF